ncbi:MAG: hypothetical protein ACYCW6_06410 [Candidatus Xenobia bacterium]
MNVWGPRGQVRISVNSTSGRDLGLFMLFMGIVASWPLQLIIEQAINPRFVAIISWRPAEIVCGVLTLLGLLSIFNTHKQFWIMTDSIKIQDAWFRRPLLFRWKSTPAIRLRPIEEDRRGRSEEVWQIKLITGDYEYLLDARPRQQLISRHLAEVLARSIPCDLVERETNREIVIHPDELDLPYQERVRRYPQLLGTPVPRPSQLRGLRIDAPDESSCSYLWDLRATWLLTEILVLVLVAFGLSLLPFGGSSIFYRAAATNDYTYYWVLGIILLVSLVIVPGYQSRLRVGPSGVSYQTLVWKVPVASQTMAVCDVEELRQHDGLRGPIVQIISDSHLISFRLSDREVARWLVYDIGTRLRTLPCPQA